MIWQLISISPPPKCSAGGNFLPSPPKLLGGGQNLTGDSPPPEKAQEGTVSYSPLYLLLYIHIYVPVHTYVWYYNKTELPQFRMRTYFQ